MPRPGRASVVSPLRPGGPVMATGPDPPPPVGDAARGMVIVILVFALAFFAIVAALARAPGFLALSAIVLFPLLLYSTYTPPPPPGRTPGPPEKRAGVT